MHIAYFRWRPHIVLNVANLLVATYIRIITFSNCTLFSMAHTNPRRNGHKVIQRLIKPPWQQYAAVGLGGLTGPPPSCAGTLLVFTLNHASVSLTKQKLFPKATFLHSTFLKKTKTPCSIWHDQIFCLVEIKKAITCFFQHYFLCMTLPSNQEGKSR